MNNVNCHFDEMALCNVDHLILGLNFTADLKSNIHTEKRSFSCRKLVFQNVSAGMAYPGLSTAVKLELCERVGLPTLLYCSDVSSFNKTESKHFDATQSNIIKQVLWFP